MNQRKQTYWNMLKNLETSKTYLAWNKKGTPVILRKHFPKPINNEPEDQKMLRTKLTVEKLKTKSEILHLRSKQYQQKYENIDMNMVKQIEKMGNCQAQSKLKEIWYEECSREQENSHNIGQKKTK